MDVTEQPPAPPEPPSSERSERTDVTVRFARWSTSASDASHRTGRGAILETAAEITVETFSLLADIMTDPWSAHAYCDAVGVPAFSGGEWSDAVAEMRTALADEQDPERYARAVDLIAKVINGLHKAIEGGAPGDPGKLESFVVKIVTPVLLKVTRDKLAGDPRHPGAGLPHRPAAAGLLRRGAVRRPLGPRARLAGRRRGVGPHRAEGRQRSGRVPPRPSSTGRRSCRTPSPWPRRSPPSSSTRRAG